jgi:transcriptional regulator of acetoin/glycerol metabolism
MIMDALKTSRGKKDKAAQILGMSRSTLWRKIKEFQIE